MQKSEKRHESRITKFWRSPKTTSSDESAGGDSPTHLKGPKLQQLQLSPVYNKPTCSLPLLQVWPSQDSPRGEADGQSFIFPPHIDEYNRINEYERRDSSFGDHLHAPDSGIDSVQASPSPITIAYLPGTKSPIISTPCQTPCQTPNSSPTSSTSLNNKSRRLSSALLHPDHARLLTLSSRQTSPDQSSPEDLTEFMSNGGPKCASELHQQMCTASSSTTSSLTSIAGCSGQNPRMSDVWFQQERDREYVNRRRSSTMTNRYSLFDALDLECALLRAAARGSVGPYSLSESLHKLTFTQSLAFPALARGLATKQRRTAQQSSTSPLNSQESTLNTFAKVITAVVLVIVSFLVFLIVYNFVRT